MSHRGIFSKTHLSLRMPPTGQELVDAAWNGQLLEVKRVLADAGAPSINWVDTYSRSGLHHAALGGHLNVVKLEISPGEWG